MVIAAQSKFLAESGLEVRLYMDVSKWTGIVQYELTKLLPHASIQAKDVDALLHSPASLAWAVEEEERRSASAAAFELLRAAALEAAEQALAAAARDDLDIGAVSISESTSRRAEDALEGAFGFGRRFARSRTRTREIEVEDLRRAPRGHGQ